MTQMRRAARPPDRTQAVWVKRLRANEQVNIAVLSDKIDGFISHWTGQVSIPCTEPETECEGHLKGFPQRWRGYLHCLDLESGKEYFLELTQGAEEQMSIQLEGVRSLRGMRLTIRRMGGDASRLKVQINAAWERITDKPLPPYVDPESSLQGLYRKNVGKASRNSKRD